MKRFFLGLMLVASIAATTGCGCCGGRPLCNLFGNCGLCKDKQGCGGGDCQAGCADCCGTDPGQYGGPATGAVTYPYYTTRGPRDFLAKDPRSIGP